MCLEVNKYRGKVRPKTAKEDLTFYKVLERTSLENPNAFATPVMGSIVELGKEYTEKNPRFKHSPVLASVGYMYVGNTPLKMYDKTKKLDGVVEVGKGCFHLFKNFNGALGLASCVPYSVIVKAIVPAGTRYLEGKYEGEDGIVSKAVRYEKISAEELEKESVFKNLRKALPKEELTEEEFAEAKSIAEEMGEAESVDYIRHRHFNFSLKTARAYYELYIEKR